MSTSSTFDPIVATTRDDRARARRAVPLLAVGCLLVAGVLSVTEAHSTPEWLVELAVELVATIIVFGLVVRRALGRPVAGIGGIVLGALGVLCVVPAFWTGLPLILGAAAASLGYAGRRAESGAGKAVAALVLGLLSVLGYAAIYVLDYLSR